MPYLAVVTADFGTGGGGRGTGKVTHRLDEARKAYREALEGARSHPTPEAWAKLLAAGKELSSAQESGVRGRRRVRRANTAPTIQELEEAEPRPESELELRSDSIDSTDLQGA